jgi:DNA repair exonuclease SbcCD ATPase subunit
MHKKEYAELKEDLISVEEAQFAIQSVAQETQSQLRIHISSIVSMALDSIFEEPYKFDINFVIKRGQTEASIKFKKDGNEIDPMSASGGGPVDIAAFALRIALWNISKPKPNNTIILDEPLKFLSKDLRPRAGLLFKELSKSLGIQFIIVTHDPELIEIADKIFKVRQVNGVSKVSIL